MNTPIIDPMFFYWLQILESFNVLLVVVIIIGLIALLMLGIAALTEDEFCDSEYSLGFNRHTKKRDGYIASAKKVAISLIIPILAVIFIPSKTTIIEMVAASRVTPGNIQMAKQIIIDTAADVKKALKEK